ncbi:MULTISPECIES: stress response translation initiation inhibitor YciH [Haloprofundus]|uniref:stress response translation initiation inhibitor YciH n=1 Tax=Haloprofundus TaxID=1911573 RepID=UPI000E44C563|nr:MULTISPECIES: stress response translation initiation inhibitor YciH [Haloprofundus]QCJ46252.1 stress response translation initiation inhibitor YciH [Haloprofundus sp. MHR1]
MAKDKDLGSISGLPDELGIDDDLARTQQVLTVSVDTRRYGKPVTLVDGFEGDTDLKELASTLKRKLACGGTVEDGVIELQGNHKERVPDILREQGYTVET